MKLVRIVLEATAIELCLFAFLMAALGFGGAWNEWLDLLNIGAPIYVAMAALGAVLGWLILPKGMFRCLCVALALLALAFNTALIAPAIVYMGQHYQGGKIPRYHLVSANVFEKNKDPAGAVADILHRNADAVFMQESDGTVAAASRVLDHIYAYSSHCLNSSVRIWVKTPILSEGCGSPGGVLNEAFVWLRTSGPDGQPITLATVHLGRPYPPGRQMIERAALANALAGQPRNELILTGDFNTTPWSFAMVRQDWLLRPLRRGTRLWPTWPARLNAFDSSWNWPLLPIDHIYSGHDWTGLTLQRFRTMGSDHFGTDAYLALQR